MVLVKGQNKIRDQQAQIEKLGKENAELKEKSTAGGPSKGTFFRLAHLKYITKNEYSRRSCLLSV